MKAIVLFSGGLDSAVTLAEAIYAGRDCTALFFHYGQRNEEREFAAAKALLSAYGVPLRELTLPSIGNSETLAGRPMGSGDIYVPCRNAIFIAVAFAVAEEMGAGEVWAGLIKAAPDEDALPDSDWDFAEALDKALGYGMRAEVLLVCPLLDCLKNDVRGRGRELGVPLELSWSCFGGEEKPCGVCLACKERANAVDPGPQKA